MPTATINRIATRSVGAALACAVTSAGLLFAAPAEAATFGISVATTQVPLAGGSVSVTLTGVPQDQGAYVRFCVAPPAGGRPAADACDGQGVWAVHNYPYGPAPSDGSVADPDAGAISLAVRPAIGNTDCTTSTCGVFVRRDHRGADDTALDRFVPVTFADDEPSESPTASPTPTGSTTATDGATAEPESSGSGTATESAPTVSGGTGSNGDGVQADDTSGAAATTGELAATGSTTRTLTVVALAMLAVGAGLRFVGRRRVRPQA